MRRVPATLVVLGLVMAAPLAAQSAADSAAIRATALDYIEGWYSGNVERMTRALHPELAKRIMMPDNAQNGRRTFQHMGAEALIGYTRQGGGTRTPANARRTDVKILDVFKGSASVRVDAHDWIDYMHIARDGNGKWVIVNVLWELRAAG